MLFFVHNGSDFCFSVFLFFFQCVVPKTKILAQLFFSVVFLLRVWVLLHQKVWSNIWKLQCVTNSKNEGVVYHTVGTLMENTKHIVSVSKSLNQSVKPYLDSKARFTLVSRTILCMNLWKCRRLRSMWQATSCHFRCQYLKGEVHK